MSTRIKTKNSKTLADYIIQENPILSQELKNQIQGKSLRQIGDIIVSSDRYRNAFLDTVNLIAVTIIADDEAVNQWENFTEQGEIRFGQTIREMILDLVEAQDYNEHMFSATHFLEQEVPNLFNYFHDLNVQKFYKTTINVPEFSLAFDSETGMYDLIDKVYNSLRKSYMYDRYIIDKYQVQRRIINGTVPAVKIDNFATNTPRQNVTKMKEYSNNMIFMNNKYNPAGIHRQTPFSKQRAIISTGFEAQISTEVLATSFFKDEAEMRTKMAMIDGFATNDWERLSKLLGDSYTAFTDDELTSLSGVVGMIITDDWFKDYRYLLDEQAEFKNPENLSQNLWLHTWRCYSSSPFEQCIAFTKDTSAITSVALSPSSANVTKGQNLQFSPVVTVASGIPNKAVYYSIPEAIKEAGASIDQNGLLKIPSNMKNLAGVQGVYTLEILTALATGETLSVDGVDYTVVEADDTAVKQATALKTALEADTTFNSKYTITRSSAELTFTEKSGKYGSGLPTVDDSDLSTGVVEVGTTTRGVTPTANFNVTATSIYDTTKSGTASVSIS